MEAQIVTYRAPSGSNFAASVGLLVSRAAANLKEVALLTDPLVEPLGVVVDADDVNGGKVMVCIAGPCQVIAGDAISGATATTLMAGAASRAFVFAATADRFQVGKAVMDRLSAVAAGDVIDIIVNIVGPLDT